MNNKVIAVLFLFVVLIGCKEDTTGLGNQTGDFSIFLLKDDTLTTEQAKQIPLATIIVKDDPITSINDVVSYNWSEHSIELTKEGFNKFKSVESKIISTLGLPFIVMVGHEKVYLGNIYPYYSSYMHTDVPFIGVSPFTSLRIARAPDTKIEDRRSDERIYKALERRNKLK
jgi:hypothetical protein